MRKIQHIFTIFLAFILLIGHFGNTVSGEEESKNKNTFSVSRNASFNKKHSQIQPGPIGQKRESCHDTSFQSGAFELAKQVHPSLKIQRKQVRSFYRDINNTCIHWVQATPLDENSRNQKVVFLLHGYPQFWVSWSKMITPLVKAGYTVVMPDARGIYKSGHPKDVKSYMQSNLARDVLTLMKLYRQRLNKKNQKFDVVAYDTGGMTGWYLAAYPGSYIRRVTIVNFPHPELYREDLLLKNRYDRGFSQFPLSYFVFGQAYMPQEAINYFFMENKYSILSKYVKDSEFRQDRRKIQNLTVPVPKRLWENEDSPKRMKLQELKDDSIWSPLPFISDKREYYNHYMTIFDRLNFEMRYLRMAFDKNNKNRPQAIIHGSDDEPTPEFLSVEEVKLYTDALIRNIEGMSQLKYWFKTFEAMASRQDNNHGFLWIPETSLDGNMNARRKGEQIATCSILRRDVFGSPGTGDRLGFFGEDTGVLRTMMKSALFSKIYGLDGSYKDACLNDDEKAVLKGFSRKGDSYSIPRISVPVQMVWGYHDAYLNTLNFTEKSRYKPLFEHFERNFSLTLLGGPDKTYSNGYPKGSHWTIDEFPERVVRNVLDHFEQ